MLTLKDNEPGIPFESLGIGELFIYAETGETPNLHYKFSSNSAVYLVSQDEKETESVGDPYQITNIASTKVHRVKIIDIVIKKYKA